jgi:hypothetical protein
VRRLLLFATLLVSLPAAVNAQSLTPMTPNYLNLGGATLLFDGAALAASVGLKAPSIELTAASGANAISVSNDGARTDFGAGASDYASSNGTTVTFAGPVAASNLSGTNTGNVTIGTANGLSITTPGQVLSLSLAGVGTTAGSPGAVSGVQEAQMFAGTKFIENGFAFGVGNTLSDSYQALGSDGTTIVAMGDSSACATSPDGYQWTKCATSPGGNWADIAWNGTTTWVSVGTAVAASSTDGTNWTNRTIAGVVWYSVTWSSTLSLFIATGIDSVATSPDGITWTSRTVPAGNYRAVECNATVCAIVATNYKAASSPDGITWTARTITTDSRGLAWNGTVFAAVGATSGCSTSPDGITWTARTIPTGTYAGVQWNGSIFAANGVNVAASSPDGITWTARTIPGGHFSASTLHGTMFVTSAADSAGAISTDGVTWRGIVIGATGYMSASPRCVTTLATTMVPFCNGSSTDCYLDQSITCKYAMVGAECLVGSPAALEAGLTQTCKVSAADTIILTTRNSTHGDITPAGSQIVSVRTINP